jgi:hypothetical protein
MSSEWGRIVILCAHFSRDDVQTFLRGVVAVTADQADFHLTGKIDNPPRFWFPNLGEDYTWEVVDTVKRS